MHFSDDSLFVIQFPSRADGCQLIAVVNHSDRHVLECFIASLGLSSLRSSQWPLLMSFSWTILGTSDSSPNELGTWYSAKSNESVSTMYAPPYQFGERLGCSWFLRQVEFRHTIVGKTKMRTPSSSSSSSSLPILRALEVRIWSQINREFS